MSGEENVGFLASPPDSFTKNLFSQRFAGAIKNAKMAEEPQTPSFIRLGAGTGEHDDDLLAFAPVRPRLFGIAYPMLEVRRKPRMSPKTFGCRGNLRIAASLQSQSRPKVQLRKLDPKNDREVS